MFAIYNIDLYYVIFYGYGVSSGIAFFHLLCFLSAHILILILTLFLIKKLMKNSKNKNILKFLPIIISLLLIAFLFVYYILVWLEML